jgi:hypothetical protein
MPEITSCPQCQRKLRVPDDLIGHKVKCPGCGLNFTADIDRPAPPPMPVGAVEDEPSAGRRAIPVPSPPPPVPDDDYGGFGGYPRRRPNSQERQEWMSVRVGLTLLIVSLFIGLTASFIFGVGVAVAASAPRSTVRPPFPSGSEPDGTQVLGGMMILCSLVFLLAWRIVSIVGYCFYVSLPARADSRGLAGTALGLAIAWPILLLIGILLFVALDHSATSSMLTDPTGGTHLGGRYTAAVVLVAVLCISSLLFVTELVCTLLLYRNVARTLNASGLASSAFVQLILGVVLEVWIIAQMVAIMIVIRMALSGSISFSAADSISQVSNVFLVLWLILIVGWSIWYLVTTFLVRGVVDGHIQRS